MGQGNRIFEVAFELFRAFFCPFMRVDSGSSNNDTSVQAWSCEHVSVELVSLEPQKVFWRNFLPSNFFASSFFQK